MIVRALLSTAVMVAGFGAQAALAQDSVPECLDRNGQSLAVNNAQVLGWKQSTPNSYHDRAHVKGTLVQVYADHSGHHHLEVQIGSSSSESVEVIYNEDFGSTPSFTQGSEVEACGDYITSNAPAGPYPQSPDGAIVHWVHRSPNLDRHPSGYLLIDGQLYGDEAETAGPKHHGSRR